MVALDDARHAAIEPLRPNAQTGRRRSCRRTHGLVIEGRRVSDTGIFRQGIDAEHVDADVTAQTHPHPPPTAASNGPEDQKTRLRSSRLR